MSNKIEIFQKLLDVTQLVAAQPNTRLNRALKKQDDREICRLEVCSQFSDT